MIARSLTIAPATIWRLSAVTGGGITDPTPVDQMYRRVAEITGAAPLPYGIEPNRARTDG